MSDGCDCTPPSTNRGGSPACDPTTQPCPHQPCASATINLPKGSQSSSSNPTNSWLTSPCFHFDYQGVVAGISGSYVLSVSGAVVPAPPFTCHWDLPAAAGTLTNPDSCTPTHTEPNAAGEGDLQLTGMNGTTAGACQAQKKFKIYQDHLARDRDNFGVGISCGANGSNRWRFTHLGARITMSRAWNCHGGTLHIYNGGGSGNTGPRGVAFLFNASRLKNTVLVTHTPTGEGSHPALGPLVRGDIVAYFTGSGDLAHTQTCTGNGTETYGANNVPVRFPGRPRLDEAWQWSTSTAGDWANDIKTNLFPGATPFTIKVFSKP